MASYLDKTGLTYLWGKITSALSGKADMAVIGDVQSLSPYPEPTSIANFTRALNGESGSYGFGIDGTWNAYNGSRTAFIVPVPNPSAKYIIAKNGVATVAINAVTSAIFDYIEGTSEDTGFLANLASGSASTTDLVIDAGTLPSATEYLAISVTKTNRELVTISTEDYTIVQSIELLQAQMSDRPFKMVSLTQSEYDALTDKDANTLYIII